MPGRSSRSKGAAHELQIRDMLRAEGIGAEKVSRGWKKGEDLHVGPFDHDRGYLRVIKAEVKWRTGGQGFATIERWLGECGIMFLKRFRKKPMVVMPWETFAMFARPAVAKAHLTEGGNYATDGRDGPGQDAAGEAK